MHKASFLLLSLSYAITTHSIDFLKIASEDLSSLLQYSLISKFYLHCHKEFPEKKYSDRIDDPMYYESGNELNLNFHTIDCKETTALSYNGKSLTSSSAINGSFDDTYINGSLGGEPPDGPDEEFNFCINDQSIRRYFSDVDPLLSLPKTGDDLTKATFFRDSLIKNITAAEGDIYIDNQDGAMASYLIKEKIDISSITIGEMENYKYQPPCKESGFPGGVYFRETQAGWLQHTDDHFNK